MIKNARITGKVENREGDGPNITIRPGPCEVAETALDASFRWTYGDSHDSAAMPAGNVGNAPFFFAPASWLMTWRSRRLHAFESKAAFRHGAVVVNRLRESAGDPFVQRPALNGVDGLHPSSAGYRVWFGELMAQAALPQRPSIAVSMDR